MDDFNHTTQIETNIYSIIRPLQRSKKPFSVYLFLFFLPFASLRSSHLSEVHQVIQHFLINPTSLLLFWINVTAHRRRRICPPKRVVPPQSLGLISLTLRHTSLGPRRRHSTQQDAAWSAQKTTLRALWEATGTETWGFLGTGHLLTWANHQNLIALRLALRISPTDGTNHICNHHPLKQRRV